MNQDRSVELSFIFISPQNRTGNEFRLRKRQIRESFIEILPKYWLTINAHAHARKHTHTRVTYIVVYVHLE